MSFSASPTLSDPHALYLDIPDEVSPASTAPFSTAGAHWRAKLNQWAIAALLPWLQADHSPRARLWQASTQASRWELVNGSAIECPALGQAPPFRLVILPTDAIDTDELLVPQEWVDLPSWAGDYYLAVQINPDEGWIKLAGYTTHAQLKASAHFDPFSRSYSLPQSQWISDINVLWLAREFDPTAILRADIAPLPPLTAERANHLIQRLGQADLAFPRLDVPFSVWGALVEHGGWRQRLYEQRQGIAEPWSVSQWLRSGVSALAGQIGWEQLQLAPVSAMRSLPIPAVVRSLTIDGSAYELRIFIANQLRQLDVANDSSNETPPIWRFELGCSEPTRLIPTGFTLRLLSEDLQPFENNTDVATAPVASLYVDVVLAPEEGIVWEIIPAPEEGDREILRF
jgi:hypothetical protein